MRKTGALSTALEAKTGQLAAATEDLEVRFPFFFAQSVAFAPTLACVRYYPWFMFFSFFFSAPARLVASISSSLSSLVNVLKPNVHEAPHGSCSASTFLRMFLWGPLFACECAMPKPMAGLE